MRLDTTPCPVIIVGAGPVGMTAAADLVQAGIAVIVLEKGECLSQTSRASTFHPPTLDMLHQLGFAQTLIAQGLKAPKVQYGSTVHGELGVFDFCAIGDMTAHPFRLQAEQFKLTRIIYDALKNNPLFAIRFATEVVALSQDADSVTAVTRTGQTFLSAWLIGADGANSIVRRCQKIVFEGFTWPERFLVVSTSADIARLRPGITSVSYWADPIRWHFLLRLTGAWRVMLPVPEQVSDTQGGSLAYAQTSLASVLPGSTTPLPIEHVTLYRVHQRVANRFRTGRTFLAGDAAHINNPLGGMGMNGGLHDALNLTQRLRAVIQNRAGQATLDGYDRQRRTVTLEAIQMSTIQNKQNLEARTHKDRLAFARQIRHALTDKEATRHFLKRISMIESLERAAML